MAHPFTPQTNLISSSNLLSNRVYFSSQSAIKYAFSASEDGKIAMFQSHKSRQKSN